jgi:hypothetical protein
MDYDFFHSFLEGKEDVNVEHKDLEVFSEDEELDVWARKVFQIDGSRYRLTIKQKEMGRENAYNVKIVESDPLKLEDGYTDWRRPKETNYAFRNDYGFELNLREFLEDETEIEFENLQERLSL